MSYKEEQGLDKQFNAEEIENAVMLIGAQTKFINMTPNKAVTTAL